MAHKAARAKAEKRAIMKAGQKAYTQSSRRDANPDKPMAPAKIRRRAVAAERMAMWKASIAVRRARGK